MDLQITARHFDLTPDVKEYAEHRIIPLRRFFDKAIAAELVLMSQRYLNNAELTFHLPGGPISVSDEAKEIFESIDLVAEKMERQLKKRHDIIRNHRGKARNEQITEVE